MSKPPRTAKSSGSRPAATIRDVARRAGVSTATVSRALAAPDRVADETRARVTAAIAETGYIPNASARNLRARSTKIVLALLPGMSNTFFTPILNAIEDTLSAAGYGMIIGDTRNSLAKEAHYTRFIRAGQVDGVILFTGHLPREEDSSTLASDRVPIALVCNEIEGDGSRSVFDVGNREAARAAVEYLMTAGHRRVAHIAGSPRNIEARERLQGYRDALAAAGVDGEWVIEGADFRFADGVAAATAFLAMEERPTAVFASADDVAIGFIRTIRDSGLRTPDDVSVVGFDDIDYASVIDPPLTTMRQPRAELGRLAAEDLLARMGPVAPVLPPTRVRLKCELIERDSVRQIGPAQARPGRAMRRAGRGAASGRLYAP